MDTLTVYLLKPKTRAEDALDPRKRLVRHEVRDAGRLVAELYVAQSKDESEPHRCGHSLRNRRSACVVTSGSDRPSAPVPGLAVQVRVREDPKRSSDFAEHDLIRKARPFV